MKPAPFDYRRPATLEEALGLLAQKTESGARILAGGQSLVPMMAYRLATPSLLIDINAIAELNELGVGPDAITIGAGIRHAEIERAALPGPTGSLLRAVAAHIAHYPIRVRGSFCGSLAHADPASEWCLVAATLGATLVARSAAATRAIPADAFFEGIMSTALRSDEILIKAIVPTLPACARFGFAEFSRRRGDFAIASALATGRLDTGRLADCRLGIGAVETFPRRIARIEQALEGKQPSIEAFERAARVAADDVAPIADATSDPAFRRDLVRALTLRALREAFL